MVANYISQCPSYIIPCYILTYDSIYVELPPALLRACYFQKTRFSLEGLFCVLVLPSANSATTMAHAAYIFIQ